MFPSNRCTLCPEHLPEHLCPSPPWLPLLQEEAPTKPPCTTDLGGQHSSSAASLAAARPRAGACGLEIFLGITGAGNLHKHLRVMAGTKDTLLGVPPARRNTLSLLTEEHEGASGDYIYFFPDNFFHHLLLKLPALLTPSSTTAHPHHLLQVLGDLRLLLVNSFGVNLWVLEASSGTPASARL